MRDFVVVGAGPAGSRFARRAAERGHDVLVLEQGEVGKPLACSGHVSTDVWDYADGARDDLLQNEIYGARFHVDGPAENGSSTDPVPQETPSPPHPESPGADTYPFYKREVVSNVIDRVGLDRWLADLAREAGAEVREEHTVTAVDEREDRVIVTARGPDGEETFEARMIAGCDGPRSRVRDELGLPEPEDLLHGVLGFAEEPDHDDFVDVHLTPPTFFAWRIPRGEAGVEYGLAVPADTGAREAFEELCDGYGVDATRTCSGAIPIGPPDEVTSHRGFLIGDAAAQTKPFTGGGILYGMTCADHAARTIDPEWPPTLAEYEQAWREDLGGEIAIGKGIRRAYSLPEPIQRAGLRALSGEIGVHMDRPTTLFSREHLSKLF